MLLCLTSCASGNVWFAFISPWNALSRVNQDRLPPMIMVLSELLLYEHSMSIA